MINTVSPTAAMISANIDLCYDRGTQHHNYKKKTPINKHTKFSHRMCDINLTCSGYVCNCKLGYYNICCIRVFKKQRRCRQHCVSQKQPPCIVAKKFRIVGGVVLEHLLRITHKLYVGWYQNSRLSIALE